MNKNNKECKCHCHNNHEGFSPSNPNAKAYCKCLPNCEHCRPDPEIENGIKDPQQSDRLTCSKHNRILIGKEYCAECKKDQKLPSKKNEDVITTHVEWWEIEFEAQLGDSREGTIFYQDSAKREVKDFIKQVQQKERVLFLIDILRELDKLECSEVLNIKWKDWKHIRNTLADKLQKMKI